MLALALILSGTLAADATYFPAPEVQAAFAKGASLLKAGPYSVNPSRREKPGLAEVHDLDTDVIYVVEGQATLVTGGRAVGLKPTEPNEKRGASIEGGTTRKLAKGDVVVIPNGLPHQFVETTNPFLYYTVKVTETKR